MTNILLVDDDIDDQSIFCDAIKSLNLKIGCALADNGKEALDWLTNANRLPDLIFLDVNMPVMDGSETLRALKKSERLRQIPVVIYSTSANAVEMASFQAMGAEYMTKPTSFSTLVAGLMQIFQKRSLT